MATPQTYLNGELICFPYQKAEALFYYIAIEKLVTKDQIIAMFWSNLSNTAAKQNMRQTLYVLKKTFGSAIIKSLPNHQLSFSHTFVIRCDLDDFYENRKIGLYKGEILNGLYIRNAESFEEWLLRKRKAAKNFFLSNYLEQMKAIPANKLNILEDYFNRCINESPFDERAYTIILKAYLENDMPQKGIRLYQKLCTLLDRELGVEPTNETTTIYYQLLNNSTIEREQRFMHNHAVISSGESINARDIPLCHRNQLKQIRSLYSEYLAGKGRAVLLSGENGIGKSFLFTQFIDGDIQKDTLVVKITCYIKNKELILQPWNDLMLQLQKYISDKKIKIPHTLVEAVDMLIPVFGIGMAGLPNTGNKDYNYQASKNSILQILLLISQRTRVAILFENIHAMDALSLDILTSIVHGIRQEIFILCTCLDTVDRDTETFISAAHNNQQLVRVHLSPIPFEEAEMFMRAKYSSFQITDSQIKEIYKHSQGNLFFIDEFLNNLKDGRSLNEFSPRAQDMLNDQLNGLGNHDRQLLEVISVFAAYVVLDELCYIQNENSAEISRLLDYLKGRGLILEKIIEDRVCFVFANLRMRDFVYGKIPPTKKRKLHELAAAACENVSAFNLETEYHFMIRHYSLAGNKAKVIQYKILNLSNEMLPDYKIFSDFAKDSENPSLPQIYIQSLIDELKIIREQQPDALEYDRLESILLLAKSRCCLLLNDVEAGVSALTFLANGQHVWTDSKLLVKMYLQLLEYISLNGGNSIISCMDKEYQRIKNYIRPFERAAFQQMQSLIAMLAGDKDKARDLLNMVISHIFKP